MEFLKFIRSVEELLYEVMTWLLFYPRTFWYVLSRPRVLAAKSEAELTGTEEDRFIDLVSPPLFLMLTILLAHGIEIALHENMAEISGSSELARQIVSSETNLLVFRMIANSFFPLLMAYGMVSRQRRRVDRETLRSPFYLQCFFAAPFIVSNGIAVACFRSGLSGVGAIVALVGIVWYLCVQTVLFKDRLAIGRARAFGNATLLFLVALGVVYALGALFFGLGNK